MDEMENKTEAQPAWLRVPSGVCIYISGYVYTPFSEIGYVKGMYLHQKVCKIASTAMFHVD